MTCRPWLNAEPVEPTRRSPRNEALQAFKGRGTAVRYRRPGAKNNRRQQGRRLSPSPVSLLRAGVENRDRATILRPARDVVADRDRPFLAVRGRTAALA